MNQRLASFFGAPIRSKLIDRGIVGLIFLLGIGSIAAMPGTGAARVARPLALLICVMALLARHRRPRLTLAVVLAITLTVGSSPVVVLPALLALLTVATDCEPLTVALGSLGTAVVLLLAPEIHGKSEWSSAQLLSRLVVVGLAVAFGLYLRARGAYVSELRQRASSRDRERELTAAQAVADERVRIARELHDVVAHKVSLMVVQAQAAAATAAANGTDEVTQTALGRVGNLGREALSEMHRMLGVLRVGDGGTIERAPQPGVADLSTLLVATRDAGLEVDQETVGDPYPLPPGVDLCAYRIVQEALTNVVRHADARSASVKLVYGEDGLELEITDDGRGVSPLAGPAPAGHGLVGMRERVALFGGELTAGDRIDAPGYRVRATLPVSPGPREPGSPALVSAIVRRVG